MGKSSDNHPTVHQNHPIVYRSRRRFPLDLPSITIWHTALVNCRCTVIVSAAALGSVDNPSTIICSGKPNVRIIDRQLSVMVGARHEEGMVHKMFFGNHGCLTNHR
jgi:hypothetical protein